MRVKIGSPTTSPTTVGPSVTFYIR